MSGYSLPINLNAWINDHRDVLKPPVCNKQVFEQDDYIVMVVGGPNNRTDYHYNETPELFYQIEGDMVLGLVTEDGEFKDIDIKEGELFLLPPKILHSPHRFANTIGLVVEQKRLPTQADALYWFCPNCHHELFSEHFHLANIETDLPNIFDRFFNTPSNCTCEKCGTVLEKN